MSLVKKEELDRALEAWRVAADKHRHEVDAWLLLNRSHSALIDSLREHGHSWVQAEAEFRKFADLHHAVLKAAGADMEARVSEYKALRSQYKAQQ